MEQNQTNITPNTMSAQLPPAGNDLFQVQQSTAPSFLQKYGLIIFISGIAISAILIILGIVFHVTYKPETVSDRSIETVQAEIDQVNSQISNSTANEQAVFEQGGFSEAFFQSNNSLTELEFARDNLQQELNDLIEAKNSINIFTTGAFYFFMSAVIVLIISTILFILSRHKPHSNSSIIG